MVLATIGRFRVEVPTTRRERMRGLLGRTGLAPGTGMLFPGARSVHSVGMRFSILAVFLDPDLRVIEVRRLPPGRLAWNRHARHVLELGEGESLGGTDRLELHPSRRWR